MEAQGSNQGFGVWGSALGKGDARWASVVSILCSLFLHIPCNPCSMRKTFRTKASADLTPALDSTHTALNSRFLPHAWHFRLYRMVCMAGRTRSKVQTSEAHVRFDSPSLGSQKNGYCPSKKMRPESSNMARFFEQFWQSIRTCTKYILCVKCPSQILSIPANQTL